MARPPPPGAGLHPPTTGMAGSTKRPPWPRRRRRRPGPARDSGTVTEGPRARGLKLKFKLGLTGPSKYFVNRVIGTEKQQALRLAAS
jgi:hypothetical protein